MGKRASPLGLTGLQLQPRFPRQPRTGTPAGAAPGNASLREEGSKEGVVRRSSPRKKQVLSRRLMKDTQTFRRHPYTPRRRSAGRC